MTDIVYVLTNEAMPGLIKIGRTTDNVETRISQLSQPSGVPLPFECYYAVEVPDGNKIEKTLHSLFSESRVNQKREFFKIPAEKAVLALQIGSFKEVTPNENEIPVDADDKKAIDIIKAKKSNLRLDAIGINPGDTLLFARDESITATVIENNKINYQGEPLSLSAAALKILQSKGYKTPAASGTAYWMYEGELLWERRERLESEQFSNPQL